MFVRTAIAFGIVLTAAAGAQAADLIIPTVPQPIIESYTPGFDWTGFYLGANAGGEFTGENTNGVIGALAGYNFALTDAVIAGVEGRADYVFNGDRQPVTPRDGRDTIPGWSQLFASGRRI